LKHKGFLLNALLGCKVKNKEHLKLTLYVFIVLCILMVNISTKIANIYFSNPVILASGILDETGESMLRAIKNGAGGVVTKSIGLDRRDGYDTPNIVEMDHGLLNAMGLPNPGIDNFRNEIEVAKSGNAPVIGSIFGTLEEFPQVAKKMESYGVDALELNVSCPHAKKYGSEIGTDPKLVEAVVREVKKTVNIPVFVKLTPNVKDIVEIAKSADKADGLVLINTVKGISIDIYARKPILSYKIGGYSGPGIKPVGVRAVYDVASVMKIPIIGVGGIMNGKDAIEYLLAGACAVQIGSALYYYDYDVFNMIKNDIMEYLKSEKYDKIEDIIGLALR
jgi:dihydroorotate dehydrogenase (NAD+) catalytic subunit